MRPGPFNRTMNSIRYVLLSLLSFWLFCGDAQTQVGVDFPHPGPIADADPSIRHNVTLRVPTRIKVLRDQETLSISLDPEPSELVKITLGKNMVMAARQEESVYAADEPRVVRKGRGGLSGMEEDSGNASLPTNGTSFYNISTEHIPMPGKTYIVEVKLTVFETNIPPQHMWTPTVGRVLWTKTLVATVKP